MNVGIKTTPQWRRLIILFNKCKHDPLETIDSIYCQHISLWFQMNLRTNKSRPAVSHWQSETGWINSPVQSTDYGSKSSKKQAAESDLSGRASAQFFFSPFSVHFRHPGATPRRAPVLLQRLQALVEPFHAQAHVVPSDADSRGSVEVRAGVRLGVRHEPAKCVSVDNLLLTQWYHPGNTERNIF